MNDKYKIRNKMFRLIMSYELNRLLAVVFCSVFYLSHIYAAQVIPEVNLTRRPLNSVESADRVVRQTAVKEYNYTYCPDNSSKIVLKQIDSEEIVSIVSIGEREYRLDETLPQGITYRPLSSEESGGELGALGLVIDRNTYDLPNNGTTQISLKHASPSDTAPIPVQIVNMEQARRYGVCNKELGVDTFLHSFTYSLYVFNINKQDLLDNPGHLVDLGLDTSPAFPKAIYLNRDTGFNLSSLENINIRGRTVFVFLDQNMGNINITSTVTAPKGVTPYRIFFVGIDTPPSIRDTNDYFSQNFPHYTRPTTIEYSGDDAFINCQNTRSCIIRNVNLRVHGPDSANRKFVHAPEDYIFYMYVTKDRGNTTETYTYESDSFTRNIAVHSEGNLASVEEAVCQACGQADGRCNIDNFCVGGKKGCADLIVLDHRPLNCRSPSLTDLTTTLKSGTLTTTAGLSSVIGDISLTAACIGGSVLLGTTSAIVCLGGYCYCKKKYCSRARSNDRYNVYNRQGIPMKEAGLFYEDTQMTFSVEATDSQW